MNYFVAKESLWK